jgi:hypothetical protein
MAARPGEAGFASDCRAIFLNMAISLGGELLQRESVIAD